MQYERMVIVSLVDGGSASGLDKKLLNEGDNFGPRNEKSYFFDGKAEDIARELVDAGSGEHKEPLLALVVCGSISNDMMKADKLIVSDAYVEEGSDKIYLLVRKSTVITDEVVVSDLGSYLLIDVQNSDNNTGFCRVETSSALIEKVSLYLQDGRKRGNRAESAPSVPHIAPCNTKHFKDFAQVDVCGSYSSDELPNCMTDHVGLRFDLDYDKVIHSKAFRRMVDKAQVFSSSKGDHYRTRMTHTQEVVSVARRISRALGLNEVLTEVIALAHDVGHTPFGHQGERSLQKCLQEFDSDGASEGANYAYGGFKHNAQSVRVLSILEDYDGEMRGLGISWQVLEGALWHTKVPLMKEDLSDAGDNAYLCPAIFHHKTSGNGDTFDKIFHLGDYGDAKDASLTLEGQVVALADEIAQRSHDVDDALSADLLTEDELLDFCKVHCAERFYSSLKERCEDLDIGESCPTLYLDKRSFSQRRIVAYIRDYLIGDAIAASSGALDELGVPSDKNLYFKKYIMLSLDAQRVCELLERVVGNRVITSAEVSEFDARASRIVEGLFEAFLENPLLLPRKTLRRFALLERNNLQQCGRGGLVGCVLDLSSCSAKAAKDELRRIKDSKVCEFLKPCKMDDNNVSELKKMMLVRTIVDYISGMTDSFALQEYERIVG